MSDYCGYPPSALSFMFPPSSHHFGGQLHPSLGHELGSSAFLRERGALLGIPTGIPTGPPPGHLPGHPGMIRPSPMSMSGPWRPGMPPGGDIQNLMAVSAAAAASGYPSWYIAAALALQRASSGPNSSPYGAMSWPPPPPPGGHQSSSGSLPLAPPGGMMIQNSLNPNRSSPPPGGDNRGQPFSGFSTKKEAGIRTESPPIVIVNSSTNSP